MKKINEEKLNKVRIPLMICILIFMIISVLICIFSNTIYTARLAICLGSVAIGLILLVILDLILKKFSDAAIHALWIPVWIINFVKVLDKIL